jgi:stage II sporulation protein AB (anti-sigma F factor)
MKSVTNEMKLSFLAQSQNESYARSAVCAFITPLDPTMEELSDLRCAVSEAVTNAILHGYRKNPLGIVYICVKLYADRTVKIQIKDCGVGIADLKSAMEPFSSSPSDEDEGDRGGMGFTIMKSFTDRLHVRSQVGRGTVVTMQKTLK